MNTSEANVVDGVETVEVIAGGEDAVDLGSSSAAATLIDQHIAAVATPQEILVPTSEVPQCLLLVCNILAKHTYFSMQMSHNTVDQVAA